MIELIIGMPGEGKSLYTARTVLFLLERNKKWEQKSGVIRRIASNMPFAQFLSEQYPNRITYWKTLAQLAELEDCDVIFDEVANQLDSRNWPNLPDEIKYWLRHHDKVGVEVYANTQNYEAVDVQFRRLVNRLYVVKKFIGSRRPAPTRPPVKRIWGLCYLRRHDPRLYSWEADTGNLEEVKSAMGMPEFLWITKRLVSVYDTRYKIPGDSSLCWRHLTKSCATCGYTKDVHI